MDFKIRPGFLGAVLIASVIGFGGAAMGATLDASAAHTNQLIHSNSPYLQQHAHNPVNWHSWGQEALDRARLEDKPIFLSIGYSACHWCHVMAHESFESERIAKLLNQNFIPIKVDREERPDLDEIYMQAVQMMTGSGGWPLSVWLTPDLKPFYGGTYFPPDDRFGRPGFARVLRHLADLWKTDRKKIEKSADALTRTMRESGARASSSISLPAGDEDALETALKEAVSDATQSFVASLDGTWGGFGGAPKFPPSGTLRLLLRAAHASGDTDALKAATLTLDRMAYGGLFDQIGGGFHRYAVDNVWLVPHFEKMLYDNALLAVTYTEAFQITKNPLYRRIATATLDYVLREMVDPAGGFHAAEDADSEGEEGKYYVWSIDEVKQVLGDAEGRFFVDHFGMTKRGNFEGHNILNVAPGDHEDAVLSEADRTRVKRLSEKLRKHRHARVHPGRDDKVLSAWNGLMVTAFSKGYQVFGDDRYRDAALRAGTFLRETMLREGRVLRSYRGGTAHVVGYLDDYTSLANAFLDLYEISFDWSWIEESERLMASVHEQFGNSESNGYYYAAQGQSDLLVRTKPLTDSQEPSGNTLAAGVLLRLWIALGKDVYLERATGILRAALPLAKTHPRALPHMLLVMDAYTAPKTELVLIGPRDAAALKAFCDIAYRHYDPARVILAHDPAADPALEVPLLKDRGMVAGKVTAYLCRDTICKKPMTVPSEFATVLKGFQ
jgi:uncharacterized protein YyaL (SSP411 family)